MSNFEFFVNNFDLLTYFLILPAVSFIYLIIFGRNSLGFLEPFSYYIFFSIMACSTGLFVVLNTDVSDAIKIQYIFTQILFLLGYYIFSYRKKISSGNLKISSDSVDEVTVTIFAILLSFAIILLQLYVYFRSGLPILSHSRLNFSGGDIMTLLLLRIKAVFFFPLIFSLYIVIFQSRKKALKRLSKIIILCFVAFSILDGSKSALIIFLLIFGFYAYLSKLYGYVLPYKLLRKFGFLILFLSVLVALLIVYISGETTNIFMLIFSRFVMAGDVFYMAYPHDIYKQFLPVSEWYISIFSSPASWFGLVNSSDVPSPLGFDLMSYHEGIDMSKGPNPRMNVFGLVYIGYYGSFFYAFIVGAILAIQKEVLFSYLNKSMTTLVFYVGLLFCAIKIEPDFFNYLAALINLLPLAVVLYFCRVVALIITTKRIA
ncbi:oligosaccharide repeat unit polymerase [Vibrio parahaemolyticus]|nr:oligosaccharide repeat unit polymerase [Vibrio parahaemolyticus]EIU6824620.1 oligosaccharide repeat unit polymerase [Vibrio parahaemolyticus]EJE4707819.1 oligosaccharide repeat unit polymerase [Vibrio parahaemolyticus]ELA8125009.1 oligosaccharide repeat unit polymerase [Vibrio parahaemolyticus]ELA8144241.1 oligosaccharide repeat unit polymerase [Vibrio parahaemolyticus]